MLARTAMRNVAGFVKGWVPDNFPALAHRVRNEYLTDAGPLEQDLLIAKLAIYYIILHNEL
jgi:hypothetical protein